MTFVGKFARPTDNESATFAHRHFSELFYLFIMVYFMVDVLSYR